MNTILDVLQHALGRNEFGESRGRSEVGGDFRNHFCASAGTADLDVCRDAVAQELMTEHRPSALSGGDHVFTVTKAGKDYVSQHSLMRAKTPRPTRSQRRYRDYLSADTGLSFAEWLGVRNPRRRAD